MKPIFRSLLMLASAAALLFSVNSCFLPYDYADNDNSELYNTYWYSADGIQCITFYRLGDSLNDGDYASLYYGSELVGSGLFEYDDPSGMVTFDSFFLSPAYPGQPTIAGNSLSVEITDARIVSDGVMNLYWHEIYDSREYYLELYRGR